MNSYPPKSGNKTSQLSSISKENNEEGTSAGFVKVSAEIMRHFPKVEPRKTGERKHWKSRIHTDTPWKTEVENPRDKEGKRKYSEEKKALEMKTLNKKLINVNSREEKLWEIAYAELSGDDCVGQTGKETEDIAEESFAVGDVSKGDFI